MDTKEINALFKLLADSDEFVALSARSKLFDEFESIEKNLTEAIDTSDDLTFQNNAKQLIDDYNFKRTLKNIYNWRASEKVELFKGLFYICKFFKPQLEFKTFFGFFDTIKRSIYVNIENLSPIEQIRALNFIFYKVYNFKVIFDDSDLDANIIEYAFKNKKVSAFLITVLYYIVAKKYGIPLYIVRNRDILLLAYFKNPANFDLNSNNSEISYEFFVNPSDRGFILNQDDIKRSITNNKNHDKSFTIVTATEIMKFHLDKLIFAAKKRNLPIIAERLSEIKKTIEIS